MLLRPDKVAPENLREIQHHREFGWQSNKLTLELPQMKAFRQSWLSDHRDKWQLLTRRLNRVSPLGSQLNPPESYRTEKWTPQIGIESTSV